MANPISHALERLFKLSENDTTIRIELAAGLTTFLTMAYIIFVNPQILSEAGVPYSGALFATCLSAAVGSLMMGLIANYPFALAAGIGLFIAFIGLKNAGVIAAAAPTFVTLGQVTSKPALLALGGLLVTAA